MPDGSNSYIQPAQQTTLGQQGHGLQPHVWIPNRGLVLRTNLPLTPDDAMTVAQNCRWNGTVWTTQNVGWKEVRSAVFGSGVILEQAEHWTTAGVPIYVHQAGNVVQSYDPTAPGTEAAIFLAGSPTAIPCMRSFSPNFFLYCNGVDAPQFWNGTGMFAPLSVWAGGFVNNAITYTTPKLVEPFNNRAVYSGCPQNPYAVFISDFGNPNSITINNVTNQATFGGIYFVPSQLGPVTSLKYLQVSLTSNQQVLLVGCKNGFAMITGLDALSFQMVAIQSKKWGILSNRVWFTIDNTAYALCTDGIRPFNGNAYLTNLVSSSMAFPVHPLITSMVAAQGAQAFVLDNPGELEATFYFCTGSDIFNRTALIMNYSDINNGLIRFSTKLFPSGPASYSPSCGIQYKGQFFAGGYDGKVQNLYNGNKYNGVGMQYLVGAPLVSSPTPAQESQARGFYIISQGDTVNFDAYCYAWTPQAGATGGLKRTLSLKQTLGYSTQGGCQLGGTGWPLGQVPLGGSQYEITPFYPQGGGKAHEFQIGGNTANGDLNLIGVFSTLIAGGTRQ